MKTIYILFTLLVILLFYQCSERNIDSYEDDPRLYFFNGVYNDFTSQKDSTNHSFFPLADNQLLDTVWIDIRTMGLPRNYDRYIKLKQINHGTSDAAIPGKHYIAFDDDKVRGMMIIPAGSVQNYIPIIFLKEDLPIEGKVRIVMEIEENEDFKPGINGQQKFTVTTSIDAEKPATWDQLWIFLFGEWGPRKMWFLMRYVGVTDFDNLPEDDSFLYFLLYFGTEQLEKYNSDENNPDRPLKERDGTIVQFNYF